MIQQKSAYDERVDLNRLHKTILKEMEGKQLSQGEGKTTIAEHELFGYLECGLRVVCIFSSRPQIRDFKSNIFAVSLEQLRNATAINVGNSGRTIRGKQFDVYVDFTNNRDLLINPDSHIWFYQLVYPRLIQNQECFIGSGKMMGLPPGDLIKRN